MTGGPYPCAPNGEGSAKLRLSEVRVRLVAMMAFVGLVAGCPGPEAPAEPEDPTRALVIEEPAPGQWTEVGPVAVSGTYDAVRDIQVDGQAAVYEDGAFSGNFELKHGTNLVEATGVSSAGTVYKTHHGLIAGDTNNPDEPVEDAATIRINESGLNLVLGIAGELITEENLEELLVTGDPIYELEGDPEVTVTPTDISLESTSLVVDPRPGYAEVTVVLTGVAMTADVEGRSGSLFASVTPTLAADSVTVTGKLDVSVTNGEFETTLTDVEAVVVGIDFDTGSLPGWLKGSLSDAVLTGVLEGALRYAIVEILPPLIDDALNSIELDFTTEILGKNLTARANITSGAFDINGLSVVSDLDLSIDGVKATGAPGYLAAPKGTPTLSTEGDVSIGLYDDILNLALFEAWRAEVLTYQLSTDDGSLPNYILDVLGGARTGLVTIRADLPPTVVEVDGKLRVQLGELYVRIDTVDGLNGDYVILAVGGNMDLILTVEEGELNIAFAEKDLRLTVRETDWKGSLVEVTEEVESLLPLELALGVLEDLQLPLPAFAGVSIESATLVRDVGGAHSNINATLVQEPAGG